MFEAKELLQADVARRAHELYVQRGGEDGHDVEDWLRAEKDLRNPVPEPAKAMAARASRNTSN
jgi:hypothetical protein